MAKKSTYQKLKEENARLKQQLHTVICDPDSIEAIRIRAVVNIE